MFVSYFNSSVERSASKSIVVLGVDDDLHYIVRVTLKHLLTHPLLLPVPELYEHVIWKQFWIDKFTFNNLWSIKNFTNLTNT